MFKVMLKAMVSVGVFVYRLTGGGIGGRVQSLPVLLLTTTGRTSGKLRTVPVGFLRDGSTYVIPASYGGLPRHPAWFFNLESHPEATRTNVCPPGYYNRAAKVRTYPCFCQPQMILIARETTNEMMISL